jgi:hypothetical protein
MQWATNDLPGRRMTLGTRQALWLALMLVLPGVAQNGPGGMRTPIDQLPGHHLGDLTDDTGNGDDIDAEKRLRALNAERQKSMVSDANKLLKLAGELNAEVASANSESLTRAQLHKLGEIEKLAHGVKEKMSTSVRPMYQQPPLPPIQ